jgi:hypothetical protein
MVELLFLCLKNNGEIKLASRNIGGQNICVHLVATADAITRPGVAPTACVVGGKKAMIIPV